MRAALRRTARIRGSPRGAAPAAVASTRSSTRCRATSWPVALANRLPAGDRVDFDQVERAIAAGQDVDARQWSADRRGGGAISISSRSGVTASALAPRLSWCAIVRIAPPHGERLITNDQKPQVAPFVLDEFLQIHDEPSCSSMRKARSASASSFKRVIPCLFGPEQRLYDDVPAEVLESHQGIVGRLANNVRGTCRPASCNRAVARYLSTAASTARGGLMTVMPAAASRPSTSMRKTTCSSDPGGMVRTSTASSPERSMSAEVQRCSAGPTAAANCRNVAGMMR